MKRGLRWIVIGADALVAFGLLIAHAPDVWPAAQEGDSQIYAPVHWAELLCVVLVVAGSWAFLRGEPWVRMVGAGVWLLAASTAVHRFEVGIPGGTTIDSYAGVRLRSQAIRSGERITVQRHGVFIRIDDPETAKTMVVFAPVPFVSDAVNPKEAPI